MTTNHTPTPWRVAPPSMGHKIIAVAEGPNRIIADISSYNEHRDANAAFIVRACNSHERLTRERDELVAALRKADMQLEYAIASRMGGPEFFLDAMRVVKDQTAAALAKVQIK